MGCDLAFSVVAIASLRELRGPIQQLDACCVRWSASYSQDPTRAVVVQAAARICHRTRAPPRPPCHVRGSAAVPTCGNESKARAADLPARQPRRVDLADARSRQRRAHRTQHGSPRLRSCRSILDAPLAFVTTQSQLRQTRRQQPIATCDERRQCSFCNFAICTLQSPSQRSHLRTSGKNSNKKTPRLYRPRGSCVSCARRTDPYGLPWVITIAIRPTMLVCTVVFQREVMFQGLLAIGWFGRIVKP